MKIYHIFQFIHKIDHFDYFLKIWGDFFKICKLFCIKDHPKSILILSNIYVFSKFLAEPQALMNFTLFDTDPKVLAKFVEKQQAKKTASSKSKNKKVILHLKLIRFYTCSTLSYLINKNEV